MSNVSEKLLIGEVLLNAGLVNQAQIHKALDFQEQFSQMKLGEILVVQDSIKSKTVDFFLYKWSSIRRTGNQFPIGYILQQASLLNNQQVKEVLIEQKKSQLKFGDIAVSKGWISKDTVHFFLDNLSTGSSQLLSLEQLEQYEQDQLQLKRKYANPSLILTRILAWTGGNPPLSRDICQFFADSDLNIPEGKEYRVVDQLIESALIKNWPTSELGSSIRSINKNLNSNQKYSSLKLWQEYREVLLSDICHYEGTKEQDELLEIGLIVQEEDKLRVTNIVFSQIFNQSLVFNQIEKLEINNQLEENQQPSNAIELETDSKIKVRNSQSVPETDSKNKPEIADLLTNKKTLMTALGMALLIPLLLSIVPSTKKTNQLTSFQQNDPNTLQDFCEKIDLSNSSSRLNLIFKLEQKKKRFLKNNSNKLETFPDICETALNEMRVLSVSDLGKENKAIVALRNLCNIPLDSEFIIEAEVWLDRWYHSKAWGKETKFYIKEAPSCPAGKLLIESSEHENH